MKIYRTYTHCDGKNKLSITEVEIVIPKNGGEKNHSALRLKLPCKKHFVGWKIIRTIGGERAKHLSDKSIWTFLRKPYVNGKDLFKPFGRIIASYPLFPFIVV